MIDDLPEREGVASVPTLWRRSTLLTWAIAKIRRAVRTAWLREGKFEVWGILRSIWASSSRVHSTVWLLLVVVIEQEAFWEKAGCCAISQTSEYVDGGVYPVPTIPWGIKKKGRSCDECMLNVRSITAKFRQLCNGRFFGGFRPPTYSFGPLAFLSAFRTWTLGQNVRIKQNWIKKRLSLSGASTQNRWVWWMRMGGHSLFWAPVM